MNTDMQNSISQKPSNSELINEHMRVLEEAVKDCELYDIRTSSVYNALDFLQERCLHSWGFTVFRQGLEHWNPAALQQGLKLIKHHLGK